MATPQLFFVLAILAMFAPAILATDYIVGDDKGWTINFDYQAWAQGKMFVVGDNLVFKYPKGVHNVIKVNGTGFQQCVAPVGAVPLTSGNDVINLATPGRKWYICGVARHCAAGGQKLVITVMPSMAPSPSPSPSSLPASSVAPTPSPTAAPSPSPLFASSVAPTPSPHAAPSPSPLLSASSNAPSPSPTTGHIY